MTHKAVGIETGTIYATGTHQQCVRAVNERISNTGQVDGIGRAVTLQQTEAIRIYRAGQHFETEAEYLDRMEKEMRLLEIQAEQRKQEKSGTTQTGTNTTTGNGGESAARTARRTAPAESRTETPGACRNSAGQSGTESGGTSRA